MLQRRFNAKYLIRDSGCWEWQDKLRKDGYGQMKVQNRHVLAHRLSAYLHLDDFDEDLCVLHTCDNRCCVNPAHLFMGTYQDNAVDMTAKGRNYLSTGEAHPNVKLTNAEVWQIKDLIRCGLFVSTAIATWYGIHRTHISRLKYAYSRNHEVSPYGKAVS